MQGRAAEGRVHLDPCGKRAQPLAIRGLRGANSPYGPNVITRARLGTRPAVRVVYRRLCDAAKVLTTWFGLPALVLRDIRRPRNRFGDYREPVVGLRHFKLKQ